MLFAHHIYELLLSRNGRVVVVVEQTRALTLGLVSRVARALTVHARFASGAASAGRNARARQRKPGAAQLRKRQESLTLAPAPAPKDSLFSLGFAASPLP